MTADTLSALRERIQQSRRTAVAQFRGHERPDTLLSELRRIVDAALRDLV
jgi:[protein-PII] uridylyltransferase